MKRFFLIAMAALLCLTTAFSLSACKKTPSSLAECYNGRFQGVIEGETGVLSFLGIPYAQPPVGELRWKAPQSVTASEETYTAASFGDSSIQYSWFSEPITTPVSEDCLTLNVWTADLETQNKPVMVFFHGGAYAWGGTSEPIYNGQYLVDQHRDVILVTVNYRVGIMGFMDFSSVPGGEEFSDARELGLLDCVEALRWVRQNIKAFGGDPDQVTVFGESAGAGIVSCLLASDYAGELFRRAIVQSGNLRLTYNDQQYEEQIVTDVLMALSGAENMADLMALSTQELIELNETPLDEDGNTLNDVYNMPYIGGSVVQDDPYQAIKNASDRGVDLLIGTNGDEQNYWLEEMGDRHIAELSPQEVEESLAYFEYGYLARGYEVLCSRVNAEQMAQVQTFLDSLEGEDIWKKSALLTETTFRQPAIRIAEMHSQGSGKTYMYLFEKVNDNHPYLGACHAVELPYVFHCLDCTDYGRVDQALADRVCSAWVSFAKTGDPGDGWQEYELTHRYTTLIGNDSTLTVVEDPGKTARELLSFVVTMLLDPAGA